MAIKHYCDKCEKEMSSIGASIFMSVEHKFKDGQLIPTKSEQEFCDSCTTKIKNFISKDLKTDGK